MRTINQMYRMRSIKVIPYHMDSCRSDAVRQNRADVSHTAAFLSHSHTDTLRFESNMAKRVSHSSFSNVGVFQMNQTEFTSAPQRTSHKTGE